MKKEMTLREFARGTEKAIFSAKIERYRLRPDGTIGSAQMRLLLAGWQRFGIF